MEKTLFSFDAKSSRNGWHKLGTMPAIDGAGGEAFQKGGLRAIVAHEDHGGKMRWHLSISRVNRYPNWEEIKDARYSLLPQDKTFAQILPPAGDYVNIHPNCFHLWEIEDGEW